MWWRYYILFSTTTFFVSISGSLSDLYLAATILNEQDRRLCEYEKFFGYPCQTLPSFQSSIGTRLRSPSAVPRTTEASEESPIKFTVRAGSTQQQSKRDSQLEFAQRNQQTQTPRSYFGEQGDLKVIESQQPIQETYTPSPKNQNGRRVLSESELPHLGSISHQPPPIQFPSGPENISKGFSTKLHQLITTYNPNVNVIYSPISLQTSLALIYTGAAGQTAQELERGLDIPSNKVKVLEMFQSLPKSQRSGDFILTMFSNLFYNQNLQVVPLFINNARIYFDSEVSALNFSNSQTAANQINQFVSKATNQRIRNVIAPQSLDPRTSAILVNALYFKAKWFNEFSTDETNMGDFLDGSNQKTSVPMMNNEDTFRYAEMPHYKARVLQLSYRDNDLSMLIILPTEVNGLADMESRFQTFDLRRLLRKVKPETVKVSLPKFRVEFELDMVEALKMLNIRSLFGNNAELNGIFQNQATGISSIKHKAFIDVNEAGSEATAVTYTKFIPLSLPSNVKEFRVDHPFMFAIVNPQAVYFVGHVVKI